MTNYEKIVDVSVNVLGVVYCLYMDIINWAKPITLDRAIELGLALLVGLSVVVYNVSRAYYYYKRKK